MANFFKREAQFMMAWQILLPVIATTIGIIVAMLLHLHKSPARVASNPAANSLNVPVASTGYVPPYESKSAVAEAVEPSNPPSSIDTKPLAATHPADAEQPAFDREFAAAAAKPYVESYLREHPPLQHWSFAWNQARVVFVSAPDGSSAKGYLGVFFPRNESSGVGFTCFEVAEDADHLDPLIWGYAPALTDAIENFRRNAAKSGCLHIL